MSARAVTDRAYRVPVIKPSDAGKVPFDLLPAKLLIFEKSALFRDISPFFAQITRWQPNC